MINKLLKLGQLLLLLIMFFLLGINLLLASNEEASRALPFRASIPAYDMPDDDYYDIYDRQTEFDVVDLGIYEDK